MIIDFEQLDKPDAYALMTQALIPRPIAWIVSANGTGSFNLAPFSYFTGVCSTPPLLVVSIGKKRDGTRKDTWVNILERGDFVVNIPPADLVHEVQRSSAAAVWRIGGGSMQPEAGTDAGESIAATVSRGGGVCLPVARDLRGGRWSAGVDSGADRTALCQ